MDRLHYLTITFCGNISMGKISTIGQTSDRPVWHVLGCRFDEDENEEENGTGMEAGMDFSTLLLLFFTDENRDLLNIFSQALLRYNWLVTSPFLKERNFK